MDHYETENYSQSPYQAWRIQDQGQLLFDPNSARWLGRGSPIFQFEPIRINGIDWPRPPDYFRKLSATGGKVSQLKALCRRELETKLAEVEKLKQLISELERLEDSLSQAESESKL